MTKTKLTSGAEIETLTKEELRAELRSALEYFVAGYLRPPAEVRPEGGAQLAGGATTGIADLYVVPTGMQFRLTRILVTVNNATFAVPLSASGGISIYRGSGNTNDEVDGIPFTSLPQVGTWSKSVAALFRDGEIVRFGVTGAPANAQIYARAKGYLESLSFDTDADSS